jgi:LPS-assembly protein
MDASVADIRMGWLMARKALLRASLGASVLALLTALPALTASAQTLNDRLASRAQGNDKSKMLVDAREVVYDRDNDRVSALGDVQIYYQGRVLEADRVTYDRKTKRVLAVGNAKLTESDGTKSYGDKFDLTDDFKDGFVESLRTETISKSRFAAPRAERSGGERTVFENGTFTGCEACKDDPEKPPLWQVKAARIIHNNSEQRIYYENASFEFFGVPVAWFPFFSSPDPSVKRLSGMLAPHVINKTRLGTGLSMPYYFALAPNYDLTLSPTYFSRQGAYGDALWRHRTDHGSYNVRVNGIFQQDRQAFRTDANGINPGDRTFRGSLSSRGEFHLNEKWVFGWDGSLATDKAYFTDYKVKPSNLSSVFLAETVSSVYLRGRGERSWFDLSAYHFLGLSTRDWQPQIGTATPSFDFDRRFTPAGIAGELKVTANAVAIHRDAAYFQALPLAPGLFVPSYPTYGTSGHYQDCGAGNYTRGKCLLRGVAGDYARASVDVSWRRRFVDPLGQEWTPFAGVRADVATLQVNTSGYNGALGTTGYGNAAQGNFFAGNSNNYVFRGMPMVGLEYRYPFFAASSFGTHHVEPIAQFIVRPNETRIGNLPNEDAQSLVFDEYTLFSTNKFSGYDRIEGGTRLNYGGRYSFRGNNGMFASVLLGQSVQVAGRNSFSQYDLANTGRNSGLDGQQSNYVAAATFQPTMDTHITARGRFDEKNFGLKRLDIEGSTQVTKQLSMSALYTRIAPQPELGYALRREGLYLKSKVDLPRNFYVTGGVLFDMDYYLAQNILKGSNSGLWNVGGTMLGFGYKDECTDLSLTYSRTNFDYLSGTNLRNTTYMIKLQLKDLGEANLSKRVTN